MSNSLINTTIKPFNATAYHNGDFIDGKSIMCIISMSIPQNSEITLTIKGADEEDALQKLEQFFSIDIMNV